MPADEPTGKPVPISVHVAGLGSVPLTERGDVPAYAEKLAWLESLEAPGSGPSDQRGRKLAKRAWASLWPKALAVIIVLAIWQLIHVSGWKKDIFPGPGGTLANLGDQLKTGLLWHAIGTTLERAVIGFGLAVLIGAVVGALVSRIGPLRAAFGSLITGLQTMPSIAWFPFAIILFGINTTAILFVIVLGAAPSIANGLIAGVDYTPPILLRAGATMGLRRLSLYRHLILPASMPAVVAGLRQGWAFAWRSLMAGELLVIIANEPSLGVLLSTDQDQADMQSATAIIIVILLIGIFVHTLFSMADRAIRRRWGLVGSS
jgi:NitT/TauT family transport system permease protein